MQTLSDNDNLCEEKNEYITRFGWDVKIKSIHGEEFPVRWVGSLLICCKPDYDVIASIFKPL